MAWKSTTYHYTQKLVTYLVRAASESNEVSHTDIDVAYVTAKTASEYLRDKKMQYKGQSLKRHRSLSAMSMPRTTNDEAQKLGQLVRRSNSFSLGSRTQSLNRRDSGRNLLCAAFKVTFKWA